MSSDKEIPKVWTDLMIAIADHEGLRTTLPNVDPSEPPIPPYDFHGFEVTAWRLGGMGMVLFGRDPQLNRKVALKLLQSSGPKADAKLMTEARALAKLDHPNVVGIYAVSSWEGGLFFAMEFIDGRDGKTWLKESRPSLQEVLDVFDGAGQGLAAAHDEGIQHGDFKLENMLVGNDGRTRVVDFGFADYLRVAEDGERRPGRRAGTPDYMAPERLRGERGDARSDQFSFCVALWRALYGWRPFPSRTIHALLEEIAAGARARADREVPDWIGRVLRKGLAENPADRYADMYELLRELKGGAPSDQTTVGETDEDDRWSGRDGRVLHAPALRRLGYVAAAVLGVVVVLGVGKWTRSPAPEAYTLILGLAAADRLEDARQIWGERAAELSDVQSLHIAREWVSRARVLAREDRAKARELAAAAREVAEHVATPTGERLAAEAEVFERIAADEFEEAQRRWLAHELKLSDEQALQLAEDCLDRAKQLADVADSKACAAAVTAREIAGDKAATGLTDETKKKGGRLAAEASAFQARPECLR